MKAYWTSFSCEISHIREKNVSENLLGWVLMVRAGLVSTFRIVYSARLQEKTWNYKDNVFSCRTFSMVSHFFFYCLKQSITPKFSWFFVSWRLWLDAQNNEHNLATVPRILMIEISLLIEGNIGLSGRAAP